MAALRTVVLVGLLFSAQGVAGQPATNTNADAWFSGCKAFADGQSRTSEIYALGSFCSGVVHGLAGVSKLLPPEWQSCVPANSTAQQLAQVVVRYVEARPQRMHEDLRLLALDAFRDAWPCTRDR